jgi:TolA-binding protein
VETLDSKFWLAWTLYRQKQYQEAKVVFRELLQGQEKVLGKEAVETLDSKFWLAQTLYRQKQYQEAEVVSREVVQGREKVLGTEHPETVKSRRLLNEILVWLEPRNRALSLFQVLKRALREI